MHVEMPLGASVAALLVLVPLPWHWRARNIPTLSIIVWLFVSNVIFAVNSTIWSGNVDLAVPVWCDIGESTLLYCIIRLTSLLDSYKDSSRRDNGATSMLSLHLYLP
jgi:hypothetical protein